MVKQGNHHKTTHQTARWLNTKSIRAISIQNQRYLPAPAVNLLLSKITKIAAKVWSTAGTDSSANEKPALL
jgi:hypothetical protein